MADEPKLPPKLDLRKQGVLKSSESAETPSQPTPEPAKPAVTKADPTPVPAAKAPQPVDDAASKSFHVTDRLSIPPAREDAPAKAESEPVPQRPDATPTLRIKPRKAVPAAEVSPALKSETARIPLEQAVPAEPKRPATIRIKPSAPVPKMSSPDQLKHTSALGENVDEALKRKTSRIPLEEVLSDDKPAEKAAAADAAPRTIKIKRPSDAGTVKAQKAPIKIAEVKAPTPIPADTIPTLGETARLDDSAANPDADPAPTQKKTIKVKRPSSPTLRRPKVQTDAAEESSIPVPQLNIDADAKPVAGLGWFSMVVTIATVLVIGAMVYLLVAQAIGPNRTLTQLSYSIEAPELPLPGRME